MNLNTTTSPQELKDLIATADKSLSVHNIALDFDGEVIIDPEKHFPNVDTMRYKFCTMVKDAKLHYDNVVQELYQTLFSIYNMDLYMGYEEDENMNIAA